VRRWQAVLALFDERDEKSIADHPDAKKQQDLVQAFIVQVGQLVQNSPKGNGNGAMCKQLADSSSSSSSWMDKPYLLAYFTCMQTYREMGDRLQPSNMELGQEDASQVGQNKR
jgi:hypothetical protein